MSQENNPLDILISHIKNNPRSSAASQESDNMSIEEKIYDISNFHKLNQAKENLSSDIKLPKKMVPLKKRQSSGNKETLKEKLQKRNKAKKEEETANFLEGKKFTFIPYDMEVTPKRIQILSQNMTKKGATVIPSYNFRWNFEKFGDVFVITARKMPYDYLLGKVPAIFHHEMEQFTFVDCDWVSSCLQNNMYVSPKPYLIKWHHRENPFQMANPRQTTKFKEEKSEPVPKEKKEERIGATFLRQDTAEDPKNVKAEVGAVDLKRNEKSHITIESDNGSDAETVIIDQNDDDEKIEPEEENKSMDAMEIETSFKKEEEIPKPLNTAKRDISFVISDDEDDDLMITGGNKRKRMKLENDDFKGTFLEEIKDLASTKTEVKTEVKDYKMMKPKMKPPSTGKNKENLIKVEDNSVDSETEGGDPKPQKEEIMLCQVGEHKNLNAHITNELEKMYKVVQIERNQGRIHGYGKAISIFKALPFKVNSVSDMKNVAGLGKRMERCVGEILQTGKLSVAENVLGSEKMQVIQLFDDIYGVGPPTALNWYNKGWRTIEDVRKNLHLLTNEQRAGVKYFEEFQKKIPRELVTEIFDVVKRKIDEISDYPGQYEAICGGSYRRGRAYCGDVDIIASPKDGAPSKGFCMKLVKSLEGSFLTDNLTIPMSDSEGGETYLGVCYYKGIHRRIDFKICDRERFGPLTIYYTGGDYFNRSMRIEAEKQGYNLDNFGLYPVIRVGDTKHSLQLIPCYTEHDVFRLLGLKYVQPEFRDI